AARLHERDKRLVLHGRLRGVVEGLQRGPRRSLRRREDEPRADAVAEAGFLARRHIGEERMALWARDGQHAQLLGVDEGLDLAGLRHRGVDVAAEERGARPPPARERHVRRLEAAWALPALERQVADRSLAGGADAELPGARLRGGDELLDGLPRRVRLDGEQ